MIGVVERFRFDRSFEAIAGKGGEPLRAAPAAEPSFTREDVELARAEGLARGRAEAVGAEEARRAAEALRQATLDSVVAQLRALLDASAASAEAAANDAVRVAAAIVRKMMPSLWQQGGGREIQQSVVSVLTEMAEEPLIIVRISPSMHEDLPPMLRAAAAEIGAEDRLRIVADAAIAGGDCRLEWRGGGLSRDRQAMTLLIDRVIEQSIGAAKSPEEPLSTEAE